jgi:hypothetical protein
LILPPITARTLPENFLLKFRKNGFVFSGVVMTRRWRSVGMGLPEIRKLRKQRIANISLVVDDMTSDSILHAKT